MTPTETEEEELCENAKMLNVLKRHGVIKPWMGRVPPLPEGVI